MKRIKATKTNIEKLPHPENGQREGKYFASNCSHLCIIVQPQPSLVKSYYGHYFSKKIDKINYIVNNIY